MPINSCSEFKRPASLPLAILDVLDWVLALGLEQLQRSQLDRLGQVEARRQTSGIRSDRRNKISEKQQVFARLSQTRAPGAPLPTGGWFARVASDAKLC